MNINEFMQKKNWQKLPHNEPQIARLVAYRTQITKNGFMIAFDFNIIADQDRVESHNAHYSTKIIPTVTPNGEPTQKEQENDQITPFIRRLLSKLPESLQLELHGADNQTILDAIISSNFNFTIYPIYSTYEHNGQTRNQRDFWLDPKPQDNQTTEEDEEVEF